MWSKKVRVDSHAEKELTDTAYFVQGRDAWLRDKPDSEVDKVISDVKNFLNGLGDDISTPSIFPGTTKNPNEILIMTWLIEGYPTIRSIEITCKNNSLFNVVWDSANGHKSKKIDLSYEELLQFDVADKLRKLKGQASFSYLFDPSI